MTVRLVMRRVRPTACRRGLGGHRGRSIGSVRDAAVVGQYPVRVDAMNAARDVVAQWLRGCSDGVGQVALGGPAAVREHLEDCVEVRPVESWLGTFR